MTDAPDPTMQRRLGALRWWNIVIGLILAAQAVVMGILMKDFSIDVTATYMTGPPGSPQELIEVFGLPIGWGVLSFVIISAAALLIMGTVAYGWYTRNLLQSRNYGRWIEYFFSSSIMIVLIAMLTGITEIVALLAIFGVNASMILFGLLQEKYERPGSGNWLPFLFGSFAGIIPWIGVALYVLGAGIGQRRLAARLRVRDHHHPLPLLQRVRDQHAAPVQEGGAVARLPLRGEGVRAPQPDGEVGAGVAGVLPGADGLSFRLSDR